MVKRESYYRIISLKEERRQKSLELLAKVKQREKENTDRHWIQKPNGDWIFALKSLTKEEAVKKHDENLALSLNNLTTKFLTK